MVIPHKEECIIPFISDLTLKGLKKGYTVPCNSPMSFIKQEVCNILNKLFTSLICFHLIHHSKSVYPYLMTLI